MNDFDLCGLFFVEGAIPVLWVIFPSASVLNAIGLHRDEREDSWPKDESDHEQRHQENQNDENLFDALAHSLVEWPNSID